MKPDSMNGDNMRTQAEYLDMVARVNRLTRKSKILLGDRLNEKRE